MKNSLVFIISVNMKKWHDEQDGLYKELLTKQKDFKASGLKLPGHGILWLWRSKKA
jgi:amylosucrase